MERMIFKPKETLSYIFFEKYEDEFYILCQDRLCEKTTKYMKEVCPHFFNQEKEGLVFNADTSYSKMSGGDQYLVLERIAQCLFLKALRKKEENLIVESVRKNYGSHQELFAIFREYFSKLGLCKNYEAYFLSIKNGYFAKKSEESGLSEEQKEKAWREISAIDLRYLSERDVNRAIKRSLGLLFVGYIPEQA